MKFKVNSQVFWKWLGRQVVGRVVEVYQEPVIRKIKGKDIKRNGSKVNPAYLVLSEAGNEALKLESELTAAKPSRPKKAAQDKKSSQPKKSQPKMFS